MIYPRYKSEARIGVCWQVLHTFQVNCCKSKGRFTATLRVRVNLPAATHYPRGSSKSPYFYFSHLLLVSLKHAIKQINPISIHQPHFVFLASEHASLSPRRSEEERPRLRELHSCCKATAGWWFGTFYVFSHILGTIIPFDFHIFQRGTSTTNHQHVIHGIQHLGDGTCVVDLNPLGVGWIRAMFVSLCLMTTQEIFISTHLLCA